MSKFLYLLLIVPVFSFAACQTPWEAVPSPMAHFKTCRLSVPHGWLVFHYTTQDVESGQTLFYPDEHHEWAF
jgi:hypothetical protein